MPDTDVDSIPVAVRSKLMRTITRIAAVVAGAVLWLNGGFAAAAEVTLNGFVVTDNGAFDLDPIVGVIRFANFDDAKGFVIPGFVGAASGTQNQEAGDTDVQLVLPKNPKITNLTSLNVFTSSAADQTLKIVFKNTFNDPPKGPVTAADAIKGRVTNQQQVIAGEQIEFQGFVNNLPILNTFSYTTIDFTNPAPNPQPPAPNIQEFQQVPEKIMVDGGPPWELRGEVTFHLKGGTFMPNRWKLDNSAETGIANGDATVPEPSSLILLSAGGCGLGLFAYMRHRRRACVMESSLRLA